MDYKCFKYYNKSDAILYLAINIVLLLIGIVYLFSYLDFFQKFMYIVILPWQILLLILGVQYYKHRNFSIKINSNIVLNINNMELELSFDDINNIYIIFFDRVVILLKNKKKLVLPIFGGSKKNKEIFNLINEKCNLSKK